MTRTLWIAVAHDDAPWLMPPSLHWTGTALLMATLGVLARTATSPAVAAHT